jgi:VWFA-related protein
MVLVSAAGQDLIVDVNLAMLSVYVEDQDGHPVLDLKTDDFEIVENGQVRPVRHFALEQEPIALGLVVDRSSSIAPVKTEIDLAVCSILEALRPGDEAFLITFAGTSKLNVPWTRAPKEVLDSIQRTKLSFGSRFYDVVMDSLGQLATTRTQRKALIVFSDGADHYSRLSFEEVLDGAVAYGYPIYLVGFTGDDSRMWYEEGRRNIRNQFDQLAGTTGGKSLFPVSDIEYSRLAEDVVDSLSFTYTLGFYTSEPLTELSNVQVRIRGERYSNSRVWITRSLPL